MRGAYAGGMVHALDDAGLGGCFDVVYGSSAGAYVGAGLLLGSGRGSAHIFFEDMACREFIDPRRLGHRAARWCRWTTCSTHVLVALQAAGLGPAA